MSGYERPAFFDDLGETLAHAWACLVRGVNDRRSPFHTPSVATIGLDGRPRMRTVVLRGADPTARTLRFHTDLRGRKVAEIARDPRVALHGYDARAKLQIRAEGHAVIHADDAVADDAWAGSRSMSRACYAVAPAPGAPIETGGAFTLPSDDHEIDAGRDNFSAALIHVERIETLYLDHAGHRRAVFDVAAADGSGRWITP
ncbi:MAG: pyridoxamine 5'-phosphate oxidase family protein [Microvirga sp.]|nr:pyridoxamine 5'-phosphate oxidase family protein [Microvirga sp.]